MPVLTLTTGECNSVIEYFLFSTETGTNSNSRLDPRRLVMHSAIGRIGLEANEFSIYFGQVPAANQCLWRCKHTKISAFSFNVKSAAYSATTAGFALTWMPKSTLWLHGELKRNESGRLQPDVITLNTVINACLKCEHCRSCASQRRSAFVSL